MGSLTRATLGKIAERSTKEVTIGDSQVRIQKATPLEYSQYRTAIVDPKTQRFDVSLLPQALLLLVARMWIDDDGNRLFADNETKVLNAIDLDFYQQLAEECQVFCASKKEEKATLGESVETIDSASPAESA